MALPNFNVFSVESHSNVAHLQIRALEELCQILLLLAKRNLDTELSCLLSMSQPLIVQAIRDVICDLSLKIIPEMSYSTQNNLLQPLPLSGFSFISPPVSPKEEESLPKAYPTSKISLPPISTLATPRHPESTGWPRWLLPPPSDSILGDYEQSLAPLVKNLSDENNFLRAQLVNYPS